MPDKEPVKPQVSEAQKLYYESRRMEDILLIRRIKVAARLARKLGL